MSLTSGSLGSLRICQELLEAQGIAETGECDSAKTSSSRSRKRNDLRHWVQKPREPICARRLRVPKPYRLQTLKSALKPFEVLGVRHGFGTVGASECDFRTDFAKPYQTVPAITLTP